MPYICKTVRTKHVDFVVKNKCFYYNPEQAKGKRAVRRCPTGESKQQQNRRAAYLKRKYHIYENFDVGDMWVTLTYSKPTELEPEEAHRNLMCVLSKIRKKLARKGIPLTYYIKTEAGERTRAHHHLFIKNNFDVIGVLWSYWKEFGKIRDFREIYDFTSGKLVKYFLDGGMHKGLSFEKYAHSRNLREPVVEVRIYPFNSFRAIPRLPKAQDGMQYILQNLYNGFPDLDGFIYQEYELIKIPLGAVFEDDKAGGAEPRPYEV